MASSLEFVTFVCEQVKGAGVIRFHKMFGEYMVYINDKPILLVCDNTVYIKMLPAIAAYMADSATGTPYQSAKEHYILDIDDQQLCAVVLPILEAETPLQKSRQKKKRT